MKREDYERRGGAKPVANLNEMRESVPARSVEVQTAADGPGLPVDRVLVAVSPRGGGMATTARFSDKELLDEFVAQLIAARNTVWPTP